MKDFTAILVNNFSLLMEKNYTVLYTEKIELEYCSNDVSHEVINVEYFNENLFVHFFPYNAKIAKVVCIKGATTENYITILNPKEDCIALDHAIEECTELFI
ncbi:hypothetical protein KKH23_04265 [Patescibacteria group bacterium]|nr:hypothetical protein [Patescibacteria group bacterium]MBU0846380.1 hypothetical protein [Patescibacteria group bacterium]